MRSGQSSTGQHHDRDDDEGRFGKPGMEQYRGVGPKAGEGRPRLPEPIGTPHAGQGGTACRPFYGHGNTEK